MKTKNIILLSVTILFGSTYLVLSILSMIGNC